MSVVLLALQEGERAATGAPASPFEVNFGLFFWTWIVFLVLLFVLYRFAFPAILKATEEREARIKRQLEEAERMNAEARSLLEQHQKMVAGAREQAQALLNEAKTVAQQERETLLHKARDEQEQMLERARREIATETERARAALRREAVDLALAAASKLLEERLDEEANRKLVSQYLGSLENKH
jgi:F-type H+-transporting ATPase subunit b